jgi:hypothetical protein
MVQYAKDFVDQGNFNKRQTAIGLEIAAELYVRSNGRYFNQPHHLSPDQLRRHHDNVLRGDLTRVDSEDAMTVPNSVQQVIDADLALSGDREGIGYQASLRAANYTLFRDQTMTSGSRITAKLEGSDSPYNLQRASYGAMNHLDTSNAILGDIVEGIVEYSVVKGSRQRIRIFNIGAGHGATDAAMDHSIRHRIGLENLPPIAKTCIETTPQFMDELVFFTDGPFGAESIGLSMQLAPHPGKTSSEFGFTSLAFADVLQYLRGLDMSHMGGADETAVVVANYAWHTMPSDLKFEIMQKFAEHFDNVVFVIGDLMQNTSLINSQYFNMAANGPLNTGNRLLSQLFTKAGFLVIDPAEHLPASIDRKLTSNIVTDSIDPLRDGHLWLAVKGDRALASLALTSGHGRVLGRTREASLIN